RDQHPERRAGDRTGAALQRRAPGMGPDRPGAGRGRACRRGGMGGEGPPAGRADAGAGRRNAGGALRGLHPAARVLERGRPAPLPAAARAAHRRAPGVPGPRAGLGDATRGSFRMSLYERTFRHVLYPSYEALRGRGMLRHLAGYEANQWRSPDEIAAIQWSKLQALVAHCWHEVPFYRSRWEAIGFEPGDLRSMDDYARLPVLTKDDSRTHGERLKARSLRDGLRSKATGGSTGEPLRFGYTRESNDRRAAVMWRGYAWTGARMGRRALFLWGGAVGEPGRAAQMKERLYHAAYHRRMLNSFLMRDDNMADYADAIAAYRPEVIVAYVDPIVRLSRWLLAQGRSIPGVVSVL